MDIFKICLNSGPFCRGFIIGTYYRCTRKSVRIGFKSRIKRNTEWRLSPGCSLKTGRGLIIGRDVTLSASKSASIIIGESVGIGNRCQIVSHKSISIGDGTILAPGVMIFDHNHVYDKPHGVRQKEFVEDAITIGSHTWLGAGCIILKGVHIGDNCVVGAGSIVNKDIPSGTVAVGIPAKVIKQ